MVFEQRDVSLWAERKENLTKEEERVYIHGTDDQTTRVLIPTEQCGVASMPINLFRRRMAETRKRMPLCVTPSVAGMQIRLSSCYTEPPRQ
jgi:hypothetical protein